MNNSSISGYISVLEPPISYMVADIDRNEIFLLLLKPGHPLEVIEYLKQVNIQRVNLIVPTLTSVVISDLSIIISEIRKLKDITWMYPTRLQAPNLAYVQSCQKIQKFSQGRYNPNITIEFVKNTENVFDVVIRDGYKTKYFCQSLSESILERLSYTAVNEIHLAYSVTPYGGLSYIDAIKLNKKYRSLLFAHSFVSIDERNMAKSMRVNIGPFIK